MNAIPLNCQKWRIGQTDQILFQHANRKLPSIRRTGGGRGLTAVDDSVSPGDVRAWVTPEGG